MKKFTIIVFLLLLFYTRFVGLDWGLPYPMHPDERNMAVAVEQLSCPSLSSPATCLNPHFYAYGQFPLYLAYGGIQMSHLIWGISTQPTFIEATMALRIISALSSILLVFVLMKIIKLIIPKKNASTIYLQFLALILFIFQPYAIQFAHFGTTESLLMLFYTLIIYFSLKLLTTNHSLVTLIYLGVVSGLAVGTKTSALLFVGIPLLTLLIKIIGGSCGRAPDTRGLSSHCEGALAGRKTTDRIYYFYQLLIYCVITIIFFILSSPQSFLNWHDFISSMNYESAVGLGTYKAFYTRQFENTIPILFQFQKILPYVFGLPQLKFQKILPYVLGWPTLIVGILGFFFLPSKMRLILWKVAVVGGLPTRADSRHTAREHWRDGKQLTESSIYIDILRLSLLLSFLPFSFFYAKWTRFIAPSFPLFSLFAVLFLIHFLRKNRAIVYLIAFISIIPGIVILSVYLIPDIRFSASEWIYKNIPEQSKILTEAANVIDLPIVSPTYASSPKNYRIRSFNFYDLDVDQQLQLDLHEVLKEADYIIVPSRRVFKNHDEKNYPILSSYYADLFSGKLGFEKVAEFSSTPLSPDEDAEETWTVFDHPVIRIYKRMTNNTSQITNQIKNTNNKTEFSKYQTINYQLLTTSHKLLVADSPEKWERGLMFVTNKQDVGGVDGMIFNFPDKQMRTFWNKNTLSHLTLYWIADGKVIGTSDLPSITETKSITTVSSPAETDTVIEIIR